MGPSIINMEKQKNGAEQKIILFQFFSYIIEKKHVRMKGDLQDDSIYEGIGICESKT